MGSDSSQIIVPNKGKTVDWLWPVCALSGTIVILNITAWLDWRLAPMMPWILGSLGLLFAWSIFHARTAPKLVLGGLMALFCAWLAVSDAAGVFLRTSFVSAHPDAWSYDCVAGYLLDYGRSRVADMSLVDQFGSHLRNSRFTSSCLLALGKVALGADNPFLVHTTFYLTILAVAYCSMAGFCEILGLGRIWSQLAAAASVLAGWSTNALIIGNYDNLCFYALMPGALALLLQTTGDTKVWCKSAIALGLVTAAILYTYPEGTAICGPSIIPFLIFSFLQVKKNQCSLLLGRLVGAAAIAIFLWLPYAPTFLQFLASQLGAESNAVRPGTGNFTGLLTARFLPSVFALGSEYPAALSHFWSVALAGILSAPLMLGIWLLNQKHPWFVYATGVAGLIFFWQAERQHYDYGAYKVLFCHSWLLTPALLGGCQGLAARLPRGIAIAVLASLAASTAAVRYHHRGVRVWPQNNSLSAISDLAIIKNHTGNSPVFVDLRGSFDQMWALTVLRPLPVIATERQGYLAMPHVQSFLDRALTIPVNSSHSFVLSDNAISSPLWQNSHFALGRTSGALITKMENPNGVESVDGVRFVWIAHEQESVLHIYAVRAGAYNLEATAWWAGPSLPGTSLRTLLIKDARGESTHPVDFAAPQIKLQLVEGENLVHLKVLEQPTLTHQTNGDRRELMLGILGYFLKPATN